MMVKEYPMAKAMKKRRLGKGLNSLLSKAVDVIPPQSAQGNKPLSEATSKRVNNKSLNNAVHVASQESVREIPEEGLVYLPIDQICPNPRQPRQVFDDEGLSALADSIQHAGLMQPIMVRKTTDTNTFELIAGERRWRAAQLAGLQQLPAIIRQLDDKTSAEWALIENLQREDLNPIDKAEAFDLLVVDFNATQKEIATQLGIDRSSVANFLRLNDLCDFSKDAVRDGRLSMGHAKVLLGIPEEATSAAIARRCASEQWSVRELERQVKKRSVKQMNKTKPNPAEMFMHHLSTQLGDHLGTQVSISLGKKKGSGKLSITFYTNEQFEGILEAFNFTPSS